MQVVTVLALLFAVVFGLGAFSVMVDLHTASTGEPLAFMALLPTFWGLLVGAIAIGVVIVAICIVIH